MAGNAIILSLSLDLLQTCQLFPAATQNMAWGDTDGPPGAGCTLKHHSLDPYGGHGMAQQQPIRCIVAGNAIILSLDLLQTCQTFPSSNPKRGSCNAPVTVNLD
jgi:hypothetical protein